MKIDANLPSMTPVRRSGLVDSYAARKPTGKPQMSAPAQVSISPLARSVSRASQMLDNADAARPEMVARGREIVANWKGLSDDQAATIASSIASEL